MRQRRAAEGTGGGKEGATHGVHGTSQDAGDSAPAGSLRGWNVERQRTGVPAEDAPHMKSAQLGVRLLADSILGARRGFHAFAWKARNHALKDREKAASSGQKKHYLAQKTGKIGG